MLASLIATILSGEALDAFRRTRSAAVAYAAAGLFAIVGLGFLVGASYVAAARRYGTIEAAIAFGAGFLLIALVIVTIHAVRQKNRKKAIEGRRTTDVATMAGVAAVTLLPSLMRGRAAAGGLAAAVAALAAYGLYRYYSRRDDEGPAE